MSAKFRVLIADEMSSRAQEILATSDVVECEVRAGITPEDLDACIADYDGLLVRSRTKVSRALLANATRLKVIGRAGIGVDNIDVEAATRQGVLVENAPTGNIVTTAEHAICLLLSAVRNVAKATSSMKRNLWEKKKLQGTEMRGKTFGVVGLGNIGRIVADLGLGLRMKVIGSDPFLSEADATDLGIEKVELKELLARADFISIHTPLNDATRGLIGVAEFSAMKAGAFLVNAARGGIVDEDAALAALESGRLAGAAFDVFVSEPVTPDHPLVMHPNVVCTPHLGASTAEAQVKVAVMVAEQMLAYAETGEVRNALNAKPVTGEQREKYSPWIELSEKLGDLLGQFAKHSESRVRSIGIEIIGDAASEGAAACATQVLVGLLNQGKGTAVNEVNARLVATEAKIEVRESQSESGRSLKSGLCITVQSSGGTLSATGTLYHASGGVEARIVEINDFLVELSPRGTILVVRNEDLPGVIGSVGTLLGERGMNVNNLHVAHDREQGMALALWSLAGDLDAETVSAITALPRVCDASLLRLGEPSEGERHG